MPDKKPALPAGKKGWNPVLYRMLSIPVSVITILIVYMFQIPNPMMLLIIPVVFFSYSEGYISGGLSGVTAVLYSAYFFFIATADPAAGEKLCTIILAVAVIVVLVGRLKARGSRRFAELKQTQQKLILAKEEAERLSRTKSEILSTMSHEIRTPMNAIIGMAAIAKKSDKMDKIRYCLDRIDDASGYLLGVINDILDMSKIEAGKFELSPSDFVLEYLLNRLVNVNQVRFAQKEQEFTIVVDSAVPSAIVADQQRLSQVLTNLLSNAAKFTPNEGKIDLSIHLQEETRDMATLRFEVRDEGIGMTQEQQARLFHAYEQADRSITRRFGGTGLGLAISKNIVERMGGSIQVESSPGRGSKFIFDICVKKGNATRRNCLNPKIDWKKVHLLAVDDSESVRQYFGMLADSLGILCDVAASAAEALLRMRDQEYRILFIDWRMPETDGISLARSIREKYRGQTIVMMSSGDWSDIEEEAGKLGISRFLSKPLLPSPFVDCINQCLGEGEKPAPQREAKGSERDIFFGRRLLLVDDVEINREIIRAIVEETGIEVKEAENGQTACELFEQDFGNFDIILMDIHMPLMDGYEAAQIIRGKSYIPEAASVPILAMTADVLQEDIKRCVEAGMNDHVGKPVNASELLAKMKRHIPTR